MKFEEEKMDCVKAERMGFVKEERMEFGGEADGFREGASQGIRILRQTLLELGKTPEEIELIVQSKYGTEFDRMVQEEAEAYRAL